MTDFVHIPGPNPILVPGATGAWDDGVIEACDVFKDYATYYLYYHGTSSQTGYQVGVARAKTPFGPWDKWDHNPVLALGPKGSWDERCVACAAILKEGLDTYRMWYSGIAQGKDARWSIGLATASDPRGPWEKHPGNPIIQDFSYVGGVVRAHGRYYLYAEHPIGSTGADYGPIALATADAPEGPWNPYLHNPVLRQGEWGEWDDGGFSEAKVSYHDGVFHLFYGGAKLHPTRILTQESIGYAWSKDGLNFTKHPGNPIVPRESVPDAAAFAEVHSYFEPPLWYLYHTLRYNSRQGAEDLGMQVLATQRPFCFGMPALQVETLLPGQITGPKVCVPVCLSAAKVCLITASCVCDEAATCGPRVHVRASVDGLTYDTEDLRTLDVPCRPGKETRKTFDIGPPPAYLKLLVENPDACTMCDVRAWATIRG